TEIPTIGGSEADRIHSPAFAPIPHRIKRAFRARRRHRSLASSRGPWTLVRWSRLWLGYCIKEATNSPATCDPCWPINAIRSYNPGLERHAPLAPACRLRVAEMRRHLARVLRACEGGVCR